MLDPQRERPTSPPRWLAFGDAPLDVVERELFGVAAPSRRRRQRFATAASFSSTSMSAMRYVGALELRAALGDVEDRVVDLQRLLPRLLRVVPEHLLRDVDEATGVDRVIGRVQDAARVQVVPVARLGELVVRGARDDGRLEPRDGRIVERRAERARREHFALDAEDVLERHHLRAELAVRALGLERVDVGDRELRARRVQLLAQVVADVTDPLHRDVHPFEGIPLQLELHARLDAAAHSESRERRRIARPAVLRVDAGDVLRHGAEHFHVLEAGAAVLGGDVVAAEVVDEAAERAEHRDAIEVLLRTNEHALAAAVREPGKRGLVRHAAREPERVDERGLVGVVLQEAATAERRAEA